MKLFTSAIQWLLPLLIILFLSSTTYGDLSETPPQHKIPRLTPLYESILQRSSSKHSPKTNPLPSHFKTFYYTQTLDHFNYGPQSYATFKQRYIVSSKYWGGAKSNSPIFAWLGAESPIDDDPKFVGFLTDNAPRFKALLVYIEHRYYGKSIPFGTMEEAMNNETTRGYFNSAQALADYAEVLLYLKKKYSAQHAPIIVFGGSYGGMLASWFRLKYPHVALGALASSAPILYFDNITPENGYYSLVTKDFKEVSENCYQTIRKSWSIIDKIASKPNGLSILSKKFKICKGLKSSDELKNYLDSTYCTAAQYDRPPKYPVTEVCGGIDSAPKGTDILDRIHAGVVGLEGNRTCYDPHVYSPPTSETNIGWTWQLLSICSNSPRAVMITMEFLPDHIGSQPITVDTVLEDISDTLLAVYTRNGSHCLDIYGASKTDPDWLTEQRKKEVEIMQSWITKYYIELEALKR
nr:lysosomal Pro-X carboxypeptidase-like [Ipomoea batatas]